MRFSQIHRPKRQTGSRDRRQSLSTLQLSPVAGAEVVVVAAEVVVKLVLSAEVVVVIETSVVLVSVVVASVEVVPVEVVRSLSLVEAASVLVETVVDSVGIEDG